MTWQTTVDPARYLDQAGDFLRSRPVENTHQLSITHALIARGRNTFGPGEPIFGWWLGDDGGVAGAFLQTPPHPVLLTSAPEAAAAELADLLAGAGREVAMINLMVQAIGPFSRRWQDRTGITPRTVRRMRLYRLAELIPPSRPVPGGARLAGRADAGLLSAWYAAFGQEVGEEDHDVAGVVGRWIASAGMTLWVTVDGAAVSMAGASAMTDGVVRVAPVYTPPGLRRRGYAGAVTAAVSQAALDAGASSVVLFTDLDNPDSNSVYQRLGYKQVHDRAILSLSP
jgi:predicted GNAT family acetyltransferase